MNNTIFSKLTPRESKFFPLLSDLSDTILKTADLMIENIRQNDVAAFNEYAKKIKDLERKGDALSIKIFEELNKTFITPFDREDIHHLASRMDDVTDRLNSAAKRMAMYKPATLPESVLEVALLVQQGAVVMQKAIKELDVLKKSAKKVNQYCNELHSIENQADDIYERAITALFEKEKDAIEVIKIKEITMELERATDAAEYVGKIIKTIIVKYA